MVTGVLVLGEAVGRGKALKQGFCMCQSMYVRHGLGERRWYGLMAIGASLWERAGLPEQLDCWVQHSMHSYLR